LRYATFSVSNRLKLPNSASRSTLGVHAIASNEHSVASRIYSFIPSLKQVSYFAVSMSN
jgi:hypothetical protein